MTDSALDPVEQFKLECQKNIAQYHQDDTWRALSNQWMQRAFQHKYMYNFNWMGRPIIQTPIDMVAMHELIWLVKPDLIIETGIAHGGSLVFSASMLAMLDLVEATEGGTTLDPTASHRKVLGVDIDIRSHNRAKIESHPMSARIDMIQGSSIDPDTIKQVHDIAKEFQTVLVCLDSNHTHQHVLAELNAYASLTSVNSYCVVFDTIVEDMPEGCFPDRPWSPGNNPKTAVAEYLQGHPEFIWDRDFEGKLVLTVAPNGYLKRIC